MIERSKGDQPAHCKHGLSQRKRNDPVSFPKPRPIEMSSASMDWDPNVLLKRAETCSRLADQSDDPIEVVKLRQLAQEYEAKAKGMQSPPAVPDQNEPTVQERALAILREFEQGSKRPDRESRCSVRRQSRNRGEGSA